MEYIGKRPPTPLLFLGMIWLLPGSFLRMSVNPGLKIHVKMSTQSQNPPSNYRHVAVPPDVPQN